MVAVRKNEDISVVFSSGASLAESYHRSVESFYPRSAPTTPNGFGRRVIVSKRVRELVDIPRAAGLRDVTVEVSVAHTKSKLKSRFFVEMHRKKTMPRHSWGFGVSLLDVRKFELQMNHLVKKHYKANRRGERNGVKKCCTMCIQLKDEMHAWSAVKRWSAMSPGHKERKCDTIKLFFDKLFELLSKHAQWMHECEALREVLRLTEEMTEMQYPHDADAIDVIRSLRRVDSGDAECGQRDASCTICMTSIDKVPEEMSDRGRACGVELPCGHSFHDTCICMWLHARLDCPVCRGHISAPNSLASSRRVS
ncbi:putative RING finger protein [Phytophthora citrophthora]|uniref:RING finger protein n=1 Tax=Phytophthora citrophthora TaxID=4793 RepID=A0AAD9H204_9STRA|nr:putative RING finger protein [Phytophthora citrophthora]